MTVYTILISTPSTDPTDDGLRCERLDITQAVADEIASRPLRERAGTDPDLVAQSLWENFVEAYPGSSVDLLVR